MDLHKQIFLMIISSTAGSVDILTNQHNYICNKRRYK